jgi:hypothetical protein
MRATALLLLALSSCSKSEPVDPPPKDWSSQYPALLEQLPPDAVVIASADLTYTLERIGAIKKLILTGPTVRQKLEPLLGELSTKVGLDIFSAKTWHEQGLKPNTPAAFFFTGEHPWVMFGAADAAKLGPVLEKQLGPGLKCQTRDAWLLCGDDGIEPPAVPTDKKTSSWARVVENVPADARKMELLVYVPLDKLVEKSDVAFLRASKAAWGALRTDERQVHLRGGWENPELKDIEKYLRLKPGTPSMLGAGCGSDSTVRMTFSPTALWELAKAKIPEKELNQLTGAFAMMTGLDLVDDVINNLTGELTGVMPRSGSAMLLGTRDEARTERVLEKLDALTSGINQMLQGQTGVKFERSVDEQGKKKFYHYRLQVSAEAAKLPQPIDWEFHFAAGKGAIVMGFDRDSARLAMASLGKPAKAFLDELPPHARKLYESDAAFVGYFHSFEQERWMSASWMKMAKTTYDNINPVLWPIVLEAMNLWELIWDGTSVVDVRDGRMEMNFHMRLL